MKRDTPEDMAGALRGDAANVRVRPIAPGEVLRGIVGSPGLAIGRAVVIGGPRAAQPHRTIRDEEAPAEVLRFSAAVARAQRDLEDIRQRVSDRPVESSILDAYLMMVGDESLGEAVRGQIQGQHRCAEWAVLAAIEVMAGRLADSDDGYLRERSHDIEFVGDRLLRALAPSEGGVMARLRPSSGSAELLAPNADLQQPRLTSPSVLFAHDLSPADTAAMVNEPVVGFVTELGTRTSHTSIMARALEIPAVVGVTEALRHVTTGDEVVIDGTRGTIIVRPSEADVEEARARANRYVALVRGLSGSRDRPATTKDGMRVHLRANVELPAEAILARDQGADGIGLYRTEFLYIDRASPPTEDEQYAIFRAVVEATAPKPVTLRTFDIGGDKFVSTFQVPPEMNPMLGLRAVRLALSRPDVFLEHLRAMVRASAHGNVKIMVPMVASITELRQVRALLDVARADVRAKRQRQADDIPLGVMIEVPSAAIMVDVFAEEAAFLSLGTNDLVQYALAVDRTSRSLAYLASPFDPSILRLISGVVRAGDARERPVSLCGAMASDPLAAVLLVGLGVRELSMETAAIPEIKEALVRVTQAEAQAVAAEALRMATAEDVETVVAAAFATRFYDLLAGESADVSGER
ncbi:MAG TPA: phosphoenolpyruvate--protein phosphotransferase [Byssovorax sp.]